MRITPIIITLVSFLASLTASAQSEGHNYIIQQSMLDEQGTHCSETVEYYDGLGCKEQVVSNAINPAHPKQATLTRSIIDGLGRERAKFLPVTTTGLEYQDNVTYKYDDAKALSYITYDALDQPTCATTPGTDMRGHAKRFQHLTNEANSVKRYVVDNNGKLAQKGFYTEGTLRLERVIDENDNITDVYTNLLGLKVLERHSLGKGTADTYLVYNGCFRLCYVLQPMYQKEESIEKFAFHYLYNDRGLLTEKTIPGCEKITYQYDHADRLLSMQDGEMRKEGLSLRHAYDGLGRTTEITLNIGEKVISKEQLFFYDGDYSFIQQRTDILSNEARRLLAYSGEMGVDYTKVQDFGMARACGNIQRASDGTYIAKAVYYDQRGRIVEQNSKLLGEHVRREQFTYTFTGKLAAHTVIDHIGDEEVFRSVTTNNYDEKTGILTSTDTETSHKGEDGAKKRTASYEYDDFGRLAVTTHGSAVQTTTYDVRDWPLRLESENFKEQLYYNRIYFNGNIDMVAYTGPCYDYAYGLSYDKLGRLTSAGYYNYREPEEEWAEPDFSEYVSYDDNGNMTDIKRTGFPDERTESCFIDDLELEYDGNQLTAITDRENDPTYMTTKNFIQKCKGLTHYTYNANGALVTDANKDIVYTEYDTYGYPRHIYFKNGGIISYVYSTDGKKLKTTHTFAVPYLNKEEGKPFILEAAQISSVNTTDYWGDDIICRNGKPYMFLFEGGFTDFSNKGTTWHYYVNDHLGSRRIVQDENGKVEATYNYYPFGNTFEHREELYAKPLQQPYMFNGKKYNPMFDLCMYDFGARMYDPLNGRWNAVDPLCEKYYSWSPYVFCLNNPIRNIDTDGKAVIKGITTALKLTKRAYHIYKKTGKLSANT